MPNNDLGTAYGRIKIDFDDNGSNQAARALAKIQKEFELLNQRTANIEKALTKNNSSLFKTAASLDKTSVSLKKASSSSQSFASRIFALDRIVKAFDKDIIDVAEGLATLYKKFDEAEKRTKTFRNVFKFFNVLGTSQQLQNIKYLATAFYGLNQSVFKAGTAFRSFYKAVDSINGIRWLKRGLWDMAVANSMKEMPLWTRKMFQFATSLGFVAVAGQRAGKALQAGFITKFLNTNVFQRIVKSTRSLGLSLAALTGLSRQFYGKDFLGGLTNSLLKSETSLSMFVRKSSIRLNALSRVFNETAMPIDKMAKSVAKFTVGVALLNSGTRGVIRTFSWLGKIPKPLLGALATTMSTIMPAAIQVLAKSLTWVSNIVVGLVDGVRQLSGGLLVLPAAIAQLGVLATTLKTIFFGLSDQFNNVFSSDPAEAAEAFAKLPEHLRPMATALKDVVNRFREMQVSIQKIAFKDVEQQIKSLADTYFPLLEKNISSVTLGLKTAKDNFVAFLSQKQTQEDFNTVFQDTATVVRNFATSFAPLLDGLRDITVVGSQFITEMSGGMPRLITKFAEWARTNRQSGQMMNWMIEAKQGIRDLLYGTKDLGKGLGSILMMFKTGPQSNWLDIYATKMEQFANAMRKSSQAGFLFDFGNLVRGAASGRQSIDVFMELFGRFKDLMATLYPIIKNISDAFLTIFVPAIQGAMAEIKLFAEIFSSLGLDKITGYIIGIVAAFEILPSLIGPVFNAGKALVGLAITIKNAGGVAKALEAAGLKAGYAVEKLGSIGKKASKSIITVTETISKLAKVALISVAAVTAIGLAIFAAFSLVGYMRDKVKAFNDQLVENQIVLNQYKNSLRNAFLDDNGLIGRNVLNTVEYGLTDMLSQLEATAQQAPGLWEQILDFKGFLSGGRDQSEQINIIPTFKLGNSKDLNERQDAAGAAERAGDKIRELIKDNVDLQAKLTGSQPAFDSFINNLRESGQAGQDAADALVKQREAFTAVYESMQKLGPMGIQLSQGIRMIAESAGEAGTRLDGLRKVLQGLGFLKVDAMEAAFNYTTALGSLTDQVTQAVQSAGNMDDAWDKTNNTLNKQSKAAAALHPIFKQVSDNFLSAANAGENVDDLLARLNAELENIAPIVGRSAQELKDFFRNNYGMAPEAIKFALQLENKEPFIRSIGELILQLRRQQEFNIPVTLGFNTPEIANEFDKQLEEILGKDITDQEGYNVVLKPGVEISTADLEKVRTLLQQYGIQLGNETMPNPAKIPVEVPAPSNLPNAPAAPPVLPAAPAPAAPPLPNISGELDKTQEKIAETESKMQGLVSRNHRIQINSEDLDKTKDKVNEVVDKFASSKLKTSVEIEGLDKINQVNQIADKAKEGFLSVFSSLKEQIDKAVENVINKVTELSDLIVTTLESAAGEASNAGSAFVDAFAQGLESNPKAVQAARDMAERVLENFHRSPPKKGPLAEHGDAAKYGGSMFVESYATGLRNTSAVAGNAAGAVAGAAINGLGIGGSVSSAQGFFADIMELVNFASSLNGIFQKVSETMTRFAKFISDPLSKGTFFGQSTGFRRTVSDAELQRRRNDQRQQEYTSMADSGQRNLDNFNRRMEIITNAENAVVQDSGGYKSTEAVQTVGAMLKAAFPEIASLGGARPDALPFHREGRALDVMIPDYNTEEGRALGDRINQWALANAEKLGIDYTIWQDFYQPTDGSPGNFMGNKDDNLGHYNHIHLNFKPGASVDLTGIEMNPEELADYQRQVDQKAKQSALEALQEQYGPPILDPSEMPGMPVQTVRIDEDGNFVLATPHGEGKIPGPGVLNPETKKPYTDEEIMQFVNENPMEYQIPDGMTLEDIQAIRNNPEEFNTGDSAAALQEMVNSNEDIAKALLIAENPDNYSESEIISGLTALDNEILRQRELNTAGSRQTAGQLETVQSSIMDYGGYGRNENPIDTIGGILSNAAGVTSDIIGTITSSIESIAATDNIAKTLVRGVANTEDVNKIIDNVQKFIELGGNIAGSVASVSGLAATIVGSGAAGDPSGGASGAAAALGSVSTIASLIQAGYETANAVIDLTQEATRIIGSYVGDFLGYLVGGSGGQLTGNVKFLLDEQTNQLLTYTAENAMDKRVFNMPFTNNDESLREQMIGNINVYGGPGSDPRDLTRQMMFQVNAAQYAGALSQ